MVGPPVTLDDILASFAARTGDAVGIGLCATGDEGPRHVWINDAWQTLFGYDREDVLGQFMGFHMEEASRMRLSGEVAKAHETGNASVSMEITCRTKDDVPIVASVTVFTVNFDGGYYTTTIFRDLTELKARERAAEAALAERDAALAEIELGQTRLIEAINALPYPFSIWNKNHILAGFNRAFSDLIYGEGQLPPQKTHLSDVVWISINKSKMPPEVSEADKKKLLANMMRELKTRPSEFRTKMENGRVLVTGSHWGSNGDTMVLTTDITEIETQRQKLSRYAAELEQTAAEFNHQALHDDLTGLGNRRFLKDSLEDMQKRRNENGGNICALHVDLDRFKHINDTQGHAVGDAVLVFVARELRDATGESDILARIGGDEFVILRYLDEYADPPENLADDIVERLCRPIDILGNEVRIGASVGIATTEVSSDSDLLVDSDVALYKAKTQGRNRTVRFRASDLAELERSKQLSDDILRALDAREFVPFYQPQVDAETGLVVGFEALARWNHPEDGIRTPDVFLSLAEELNVVELIDQMVFETGLREIPGIFENRPCPGLSFNVSHRRLMSQDLIRDAALSRNYPGKVAFELLESVFLDDENVGARLQLDALADCGVDIELDDFGSGHASIIALEQVAPARLKIDRRLIAPLTKSHRSERMVRSIIEIGNALEINVTAEGVETPGQAQILSAMGCTRLQGFLFGRPTPSSELVRLVNDVETRNRAIFGQGLISGQGK